MRVPILRLGNSPSYGCSSMWVTPPAFINGLETESNAPISKPLSLWSSVTILSQSQPVSRLLRTMETYALPTFDG
jgi:hypothetical protein